MRFFKIIGSAAASAAFATVAVPAFAQNAQISTETPTQTGTTAQTQSGFAAQTQTGTTAQTPVLTTSQSLTLADMMNWNIVLQNGSTVGQISNFIVGPQGNILYAIGTTGNDQNFIVPFSAMTFNPNTQTVQLPLSSAQFGNIEFFRGTAFPNFASRDFQMQMREVFGTQIPSVPPERLMTLSDLSNFNVALQNGTTVGQLTNFVISPQGTVLYGIGTNNGQNFVVPFNSLAFSPNTQTAQLPITSDQFSNVVFFRGNQIPNFDSQNFQNQMRQVFGSNAAAATGMPRGRGNLGANQILGRDVLNPAGKAPPGLNRNQDHLNPNNQGNVGATTVPPDQTPGAAVRGTDRNQGNLNVPPTDRGANRTQGQGVLNPAGKAPPGLNRNGSLPSTERGANRTNGSIQNPVGKTPPGLNRTVPGTGELPRRPMMPPSVPSTRPMNPMPARPMVPPAISPPSVTPPASVPPVTVPGAGSVPGGTTVPSVPSTGGAIGGVGGAVGGAGGALPGGITK